MTVPQRSQRRILTPIPGLTIFELSATRDSNCVENNRQREALFASSFADVGRSQNVTTIHAAAGSTQGIRAEQRDRYVSVSSGRALGVWVELREGRKFGTSYSTELGPCRVVFVPRGVGAGYQTLEGDTICLSSANTGRQRPGNAS